MSRSPMIDEMDARLMLLLAGELPADEARRLRESVRNDAALSERLNLLEADLVSVGGLLAEADVVAPVREAQVMRASASAQREVRAWALGVRREAAARALAAADGSTVWRWVRWPLTAAAALVAGLILWTFHDSLGPHEPTPSAVVRPVDSGAGPAANGLGGATSPSFGQPVVDGPPGQTPDDTGGRDAVQGTRPEIATATERRPGRRGDPVAEALLLETLFAAPHENAYGGGDAAAPDALAEALRLSDSLASQLLALRWLDIPDDDDF